MPSLICAVKHKQHVFKSFVFDQFLTEVPTHLPVHQLQHFPAICPMNQVLTSPSLPFTNRTMYHVFKYHGHGHLNPNCSKSHCQSFCQHNPQDTETWNIKTPVSCLVLSFCYPTGNLTENISLFISRHSQSLRLIFKSTSLQSSSKTPLNQSYQLIQKCILMYFNPYKEIRSFNFSFFICKTDVWSLFEEINSVLE